MPTQWCQKCGKKFDEETHLVVCPDAKCRGSLSDSPREGTLTLEQRREIKKMIWEIIGVRVTIVGIIGLGSLLFMYLRGIAKVNSMVLQRVDTEFKTERIRETVAQVASNQAAYLLDSAVRPQVEKFKKETQSQIKAFETNVAGITISVTKLDEISNFYQVLLAAQNDDRRSFDMLLEISNNPQSPFYQLTLDSVNQIIVSFQNSIKLNAKPAWETKGMVPEKMDLQSYHIARVLFHRIFRAEILNTLMAQERFPLKDRLQFLADVIKTDNSVTALNHACMLMNQQAKLGKTIFLYKDYLKWWEENKDKY